MTSNRRPPLATWRIALGWFCYGAAFGATVIYIAWGLSDGF